MNKAALITGSSRGIGAATGLRLASDGYDICVNFLKSDKAANEVVDKIRSQGLKAIAVKYYRFIYRSLGRQVIASTVDKNGSEHYASILLL